MEPLLRGALPRPAGLACRKTCPISKLWRISSAAGHYLQFQVSHIGYLPRYQFTPSLPPLRRCFSSTPVPSSTAACGLSSCRSTGISTWVPQPQPQGQGLGQSSSPRRAPRSGPTPAGTRGYSSSAGNNNGGPRQPPHDTTDTTSPTNSDATTSVKMADRNILPDHVKVEHYDIVLTDLDFEKWTYNGSVTYAIQTTPRSPGADQRATSTWT